MLKVYQPTCEADARLVQALSEAAFDGDDALAEALATCSFSRLASFKAAGQEDKLLAGEFQTARKHLKDHVESLRGAIRVNEKVCERQLNNLSANAELLARLMRELHAQFRRMKDDRGLIDFSDMEQLTMQILRNEECLTQLQGEYDHLFVDECQDVSGIQDAIIQALHGKNNCLFMVGDVKQSIYRFRQADPTLFMHYVATFSDEPDAKERRIFLQRNFRSSPAILDAANQVFAKAMRKNVTEMDYLDTDRLIPGREVTDDPPVEVRLVNCLEEDRDALKQETAMVIRRIRELLHTTLTDREHPEGRPCRYSDIVILLRKQVRVGAQIAEQLQEAGIPVYFDGGNDYYTLSEIRTVRAQLRCIDNYLQDLPLIATLKAVPFCFT